MARTFEEISFGSSRVVVPAHSELVLENPTDESLGHFRAKWIPRTGKIYKGNIPSWNLDFTREEIKVHRIPIDSNGQPLFRGLKVRYVGEPVKNLSTGDTFTVLDILDDRLNVECVRAGTNMHLVVKAALLERWPKLSRIPA